MSRRSWNAGPVLMGRVPDVENDPVASDARVEFASDVGALLSHQRPSAKIPPHLLPRDDRLKYFYGQLLSHQRLDQMYTELMRAIEYPGDRLMVFLYGATRAGKTTLLHKVDDTYETKRREAQANGTWNPAHIPILRVAIPATGEKAITFREIYSRILSAAQEPLIEQKRAPGTVRAWNSRSTARQPSTDDLYWAVVSMVRHRQPAAILLDEAQHLALRRSAAALEAQLDCLKSLAEATGIVYVLAGSYELLSFRDNNAQLSSRSRYLHFSRYRLEQKTEAMEFRHIVYSFGQRLPFERPVDLERHWRLLYRYSGGIVGVVKVWLYEALKVALFEGATTLTVAHLKRSMYDLSQVFAMVQQAVEGETTLVEAAKIPEKLRTPLGFKSTSPAPGPSLSATASALGTFLPLAPLAAGVEAQRVPTPAQAGTPQSDQPVETTPTQHGARKSTSPRQGKKPVGERKPGRDRVGLDQSVTGGGSYRI